MSMGFPLAQFVDQTQDHSQLQCGLCDQVLEDAVKTRCGHQFCAICIANYLQTHGGSCCNPNTPKETTDLDDQECHCPICRSRFYSPVEQYVCEDALAREAVGRLCVNCVHPECSWTGDVRSYMRHRNYECPFASVQCPGCSSLVQRNSLVEHLASCNEGAHLGICGHCSTIVPISSLKDHQESCPGQMCICDFAIFGCNEQIRRGDMDQHMRDCNESHLMLVVGQAIKAISNVRDVMHKQQQDLLHFQSETNKQRSLIEKQTRELEELRKFISGTQKRRQQQQQQQSQNQQDPACLLRPMFFQSSTAPLTNDHLTANYALTLTEADRRATPSTGPVHSHLHSQLQRSVPVQLHSLSRHPSTLTTTGRAFQPHRSQLPHISRPGNLPSSSDHG